LFNSTIVQVNTDQHIVPIVESLLRADPKVAFRKDEDGRLPIHWAASANQFDIVSILVQVKNFDPDVQDDLGWTPLMIAASVKDGEKIVDLLLDNGADVNEKSKCPSSLMSSPNSQTLDEMLTTGQTTQIKQPCTS
jgi:26S proteasome non-ATPase regulatory subunit 10